MPAGRIATHVADDSYQLVVAGTVNDGGSDSSSPKACKAQKAIRRARLQRAQGCCYIEMCKMQQYRQHQETSCISLCSGTCSTLVQKREGQPSTKTASPASAAKVLSAMPTAHQARQPLHAHLLLLPAAEAAPAAVDPAPAAALPGPPALLRLLPPGRPCD